MKNLAILNSMNKGHFEILGHFIYYCYLKKYNVTIFTNKENNNGWLDFYYLYFRKLEYVYVLQSYHEFSVDHLLILDLVYLISDDHEPEILDPLLREFPDKFVKLCLTMDQYESHSNKIKNIPYIVIFPFHGEPKINQYALPIVPFYKDDLFNTLKKKRKASYTILLLHNADSNLESILYQHPDFQYRWIVRDTGIHIHRNIPPFVKIYTNVNTFQLLDLLRDTDFILFPDGEYTRYSYRECRTISECLSWAISFNKPLLFESDIVPSLIGLQQFVRLNEKNKMDEHVVSKMKKCLCRDAYNDNTSCFYPDKFFQNTWNVLDRYFGKINPQISHRIKHCNEYSGYIHFIWIANHPQEKVPTRYLPNIHTFRRMNPNANIRIWYQKHILHFLQQERGGAYLSFYKQLPTTLTKADFARQLILYVYGGLYVDLDFYCIYPLSSLLSNKKILFFYEPRKHAAQQFLSELIYNGIMYSQRKRHPLFLTILDTIMIHYEDQYFKFKKNAFMTTGPYLLTLLYQENEIEKKDVLDSYFVLPFLDTKRLSDEKRQHLDSPSYVFTLWKEGSSRKDLNMYDYPFSLEQYLDNSFLFNAN